MDVNDPQFHVLLQSCPAAVEAVRRRLKENDGWVALSVLDSIIGPFRTRPRWMSAKWASRRIRPQQIRVIQKYAEGRGVTAISREEKLSCGTIIRTIRTVPFRMLALCGVIKSES
jgi:hypothetical protein